MPQDAVTHEMILWALGGVSAIVLAICGILFGMINSIVKDHVRRVEFEAMRTKLDQIGQTQAAVQERLADTRDRLISMEKNSWSHAP